MSNLESLQLQRSALYQECLMLKKKLHHALQLYESLKERHKKKKKEYEAVDRELAFLDGRYKVVEVKKENKKVTAKLIMDLNKDQILEIAEVLGIEIEEGGEEDATHSTT